METLDKSIEILNDLIEINNDRVAGFAHAAHELQDKDLDLRTLFMELRDESRTNVHELGTAINKFGGEVEMGMSGKGALHRMWLDIKSAFSGHDRQTVLDECERGEDAIKQAYEMALSPQSGLSPEFADVVSHQYERISQVHDRVKALRDAEQ